MIIARYDTDLLDLWIGVRKVKDKMEEMTWMPFQWFLDSEAAGWRVRDKFCVYGRLDEGKIVEAWKLAFEKKGEGVLDCGDMSDMGLTGQ
jgi:hypothetical protein